MIMSLAYEKLEPTRSAVTLDLRIENAEGYLLLAVYLFIYMRVTRITQKVLNRIALHLVG